MMEETYQIILNEEKPPLANLFLIFTIFACAVLGWTPELLKKLNSSEAEVKAASTKYTHLVLSILDNDTQPLPSSTVVLEAMCSLVHLFVIMPNFLVKVSMLRIRCLLMARELSIHCLDTPQSQEKRILNGCNMIDVEVQRRIWWSMVASDWYKLNLLLT
jgi:hypothetical protein